MASSRPRQQTFNFRDRMVGEILGDLGDDLGVGFLCELPAQVAENFGRRHDDDLVEFICISFYEI
jgi:hypothetical protein